MNCSIAELDEVVEGYLAAELLALADGDTEKRVSGMVRKKRSSIIIMIFLHKILDLS